LAQHLLAEADGLRGDLDQFVLRDPFDPVFEAHLAVWRDAHRFIVPSARMLVSFFSRQMLTSRSFSREYSPMIMPS